MLELAGLDVHYGKIQVLKGVELTVAPGEVVALVGANAAGKTTTLRTILGLKSASAGTVRLDGAPIETLGTPERVRRGLALVPEGRQVFTRFSVQENLAMGAYHRADRNRIDGDLADVFALFPRLQERRTQKAGSLSGGEQQMLAIGRGLMAKPRYLLLDEPTLGLAPIIVEEIGATIRELAGRGVTILLSEQNAAMSFAASDRAYVLQAGRITLSGPSAELARSPEIKRLYLGG
ncbi:MAG: ABC transporter ATP-binding protein [Alphaproteobacteria bacterium]|nr:ABC transporter ATP-binding protein [Alphaproteobacteria bacterium]